MRILHDFRIGAVGLLGVLALWVSLMAGCAATYVQDDSTSKTQPSVVSQPLPSYTGPKTVVAVLPLGLSEQAAKRYPHLLDKSVGMGIHNMVVEALYDSNRFTFVEEKPEIIKDIMDRQWMSSAGMVDQGTAVEMGRMLGAKKVIYGEVYDYAEGGERVAGFGAQRSSHVRMGVQVRCVDVETLEYVPGSAVEFGADVSDAANRSIRSAVAVLLRRLK